MKVTAIVGAQYGSEGKGVVCAALANEHNVWIRTGGPNAGHTFWYQGQVHKQLMLPVGWCNPHAALLIGPGAVLDPAILVHELDIAERVHPTWNRIKVDYRATPLMYRHVQAEGGIHGAMHASIGSTGKGVGSARLEHIARQGEYLAHEPDGMYYHFRNVARPAMREYREAIERLHAAGAIVDTTRWLMDEAQDATIGLEGTQGFGLSLHHGQWPYVTSADTTVGTLCADAGVPVMSVNRVVLVVRYMPIRVAGHSGPLPNEVTWGELSAYLGRAVLEHTTVTNKIRRIAHIDLDLVERAAAVNGATEIALTFADYADPSNVGAQRWADLSSNVRELIGELNERTDARTTYVGLGFNSDSGWRHLQAAHDTYRMNT